MMKHNEGIHKLTNVSDYKNGGVKNEEAFCNTFNGQYGCYASRIRMWRRKLR